MTLLQSSAQNAVFAFILDRAPVDDHADVFNFSFEDAPDVRYQVAAARLRDIEENLTLVFTTATISNSVFMTITDGDPHAVAGILAQIEDFHSKTKPINHGDTVRLQDEPTLAANQRVALLLLRPGVSPALEKIPDCVDLVGKHVEFYLVVFLSEEEYEVKVTQGLDALLDLFETDEKDLVALSVT